VDDYEKPFKFQLRKLINKQINLKLLFDGELDEADLLAVPLQVNEVQLTDSYFINPFNEAK
jgi:hypothetical protein